MFLSSYQVLPEKVIFKIIIEAEEKERVNERRIWEGERQENKVITKNRTVAQWKERQMRGKENEDAHRKHKKLEEKSAKN